MAGKKKGGLDHVKTTEAGAHRDDRQAGGGNAFEPITIDAKNVATVIYMLQSPEAPVILKAIASLEEYAAKNDENLRIIASIQIFPYLIPLLNHDDYIIKRFTQKLIGILSRLREFREEISKVENLEKIFVDILEKETDMVMHEFAALTLSELTSEYKGAMKFLNTDNAVDIVLQRIASPDPDIQKNCLDIMNHILDNIHGLEAVADSSYFNMKLILDFFFSNYPVIQNLAIHVLKQLTSWCKDSKLLEAFRDAEGIETSLDVLEKPEWSDLHVPALDLLIHVVDNSDFIFYLLNSGCLSRLTKLLKVTENKTNLVKLFGVFARMSHTKEGCAALNSVGMGSQFSFYLLQDDQDLQDILEQCCLGIGHMTQNELCVDDIMKNSPISKLIDIVTDLRENFSLRNMAAYALSNLCKENKMCVQEIVDYPKFLELPEILYYSAKLPTQLVQCVIQILKDIAHHEKFRPRVITQNFMDALMSCIQDPEDIDHDNSQIKDPFVQMHAMECLSLYLIECEARHLFLLQGGSKVLISCLKSEYTFIREWAGQLIIILSQSIEFINNFIHLNGLQMLIKEKAMFSMPSWQSALEAIYSQFLPAKYAFTGRLDFQDITKDGFYISTHPRISFCFLDDLLKARISPIFPVYVANFRTNSEQLSTASLNTNSETTTYDSIGGRNNFKNTSDYGIFPQVKSYSSDNFVKWFPDPYLNEYLERLTEKLKKAESCVYYGDFAWTSIHPRLIYIRVQTIAKFVAEAMSGQEPNPVRRSYYKEMHINELKQYFGTNIIPLGQIRMGDYLERAMLFKVLADRLGFPCALVKGYHKRAWIEVAVPIISSDDLWEDVIISENSDSISQTEETEYEMGESPSSAPSTPLCLKIDFLKAFPNYYLKPNAIVDLMEKPGKLLKINSFEAEMYRGGFF